MIEKIRKILTQYSSEISDWKMNSIKKQGRELFFIGESLDMIRAKDVEKIQLTIYKDFKIDSKPYRGSAITTIHPTMSSEEIDQTIRQTLYAAGFVKNEPYPMLSHVVCVNYPTHQMTSSPDLSESLPPLVKEIYESAKDIPQVRINSLEFFLNSQIEEIINSKGLNIRFSRPSLTIECITQAQGLTEEVELYEDIRLSEINQGVLASKILQLMRLTADRALADPLPSLGEIPIILSGNCVGEFIQYYLHRLSARYIFEHISNTGIGEELQGEEVKGDRISLYLDPQLPGSYYSRPFDNDGFPLHKHRLIHQGSVERYWGDIQYSHYIHTPPTGQFCNLSLESGSQTLQQMKSQPYLEITAFSDFQMDFITGDFGGEIRLGYYYDGNITKPVFGGSIAANIRDVHHQMFFSREKRLLKKYYGPCSIQLHGVKIAGSKD